MPTLNLANTTLAYTEGNAATQLDAGGTVSGATWTGGSLVARITANADGGDRISIADTDGDGTAITIVGTDIFADTGGGAVDVGDLSAAGGVAVAGAALTVTFGAGVTDPIVQEIVQSLRYETVSDAPSTTDRTVTVTVTDSGGSADDTRTVSVAATNDDPVITGLSDRTFTQNLLKETHQTIGGGVTVSDPDGFISDGATLQVENMTPGQNLLESFWVDTDGTGLEITALNEISVDGTVVGSIGGGVDGGMLAFIFNANATIADVEKIAQNVTYRVITDEPVATRPIEFRLQDGNGGSTSDTITVTVTPENEAPRHRTDIVTGSVENVRTIEPIDGPGWHVSRFPSATFDNFVLDGDARIRIGIDAASPNIGYQGYQYDVGDSTEISIRFYMPDDWGTTGTIHTGVWAVGYDPDGSSWVFPSLEYNHGDRDFNVWDQGQFNHLGLPSDVATNAWHDITIAYEGSSIVFTVSGDRADGSAYSLSYTDTTVGTTSTFRTAILTARSDNTSTYDTLWDDLTTDEGDASASTVWATANVRVGGTVAIDGLEIADRDGGVLTTRLSVGGNGTITVDTAGTAGVTGNGTDTIKITGTVAEINAALSGLSFTAVEGAQPVANITVTTTDDGGLSDTDFIRISIAGGGQAPDVANSAPVTAAATVDLQPGDSYVFQGADFPFTDTDGDALEAVRIDSLPEIGTLTFNGVAVSVGQMIDVADIAAGRLVFTADMRGADASFVFRVSDGADMSATARFALQVADPSPDGGGMDAIGGTPAADDLTGGDENDVVRGQEGDDNIRGAGGDDEILAGRRDNGNDTLSGGTGNDTLGGGVGDDSIDGGDDDDILFGREGSDRLSGGDGNDIIFTGDGDDTVNGGFGNDTLWGSDGDDLLIGGAGSDTFTFGVLAGNDRVADFDLGDDALDLRYAVRDFESLDDVAAAARLGVDGNGNPSLVIDLGPGEDGNPQSVTITGLTLADLTDMTILI
ncbi:calcium-binding protein [Eilatimonas milleporae]|uniref:Hemolysin type calcium-binding protein n=1 Tax=Eilatimonas milleporae TaxID=911205 RepID=A0A3M0D6I9_9PROT|nr:calcium-binding protein [Eilatimonas milleporae]RMB11893.1 hypothetical protein BXY39_0380 [Eilatimonas milleporae]